MFLSPEAQKAVDAGAARQHMREWRMDRGPHLNGDTLVIPSEVYHPEAAAFWRSQGFRYDRDFKIWERDIRNPRSDGKTFTAEAWLEAARRKYKEFWPKWEPVEDSTG